MNIVGVNAACGAALPDDHRTALCLYSAFKKTQKRQAVQRTKHAISTPDSETLKDKSTHYNAHAPSHPRTEAKPAS